MKLLIILIFSISSIQCFMKTIHENNDVVGLPTVACGVHTIDIMIATTKPFHGQVYTKGYYDHDDCKTNRSINLNSSYMVSLSTPISDCGIRRHRTLNPPGILLETTVILMFHQVFLTKDDRSFKVQCQYTESDLEVTKSLNVSTIAPTELPQNSEQLDEEHVPTCKYEVLTGGSNGRAVKYATVGEDVYHKWTCNVRRMENMYCMTVHSCTADNGQGITQMLLDERGCSLDEFLLHNLNYSSTELSAGQLSSVFKFADQPTVYFSCMIRLYVKEDPNSECPIPQNYCDDYSNEITSDFPRPPSALPDDPEENDDFTKEIMKNEAKTMKNRYRQARDLKHHNIELDVSAPSVDILDIPYKGQSEIISPTRGLGQPGISNLNEIENPESICISKISLALSISLVITVTLLSLIVHFYLLRALKTTRDQHDEQQKYGGPIY